MYGKSFCGVRMWTMDAEWNIIQYTFDLGFTSLRYSMRGRTAEAGCCGTKMVCQTECWIRDHHRRFVPTLTHTQHTTYKIHGVKEGCFMPSGMLEGKKNKTKEKHSHNLYVDVDAILVEKVFRERTDDDAGCKCKSKCSPKLTCLYSRDKRRVYDICT